MDLHGPIPAYDLEKVILEQYTGTAEDHVQIVKQVTAQSRTAVDIRGPKIHLTGQVPVIIRNHFVGLRRH
jgi:hypothetical protein